MRKLFLLLFLFFAFWFLVPSPSPVLAAVGDSCCPDQYIILNAITCGRVGNLSSTIPVACKGSEACGPSGTCIANIPPVCDPTTQSLNSQTKICEPLKKASECPSGSKDECGICCKKNEVGDCALKPGNIFWSSCDDLKNKALGIVNRVCNNSGTTVFQLSGSVCIATSKTPIYLCLEKDGSCDTAIGKIPVNAIGFIQAILKFVVGISGGIALLMLIFAGYTILTSTGDPQKLAGAKEMIVSVISGIVLIVFSMVLLNAIGVDILGLPGLK